MPFVTVVTMGASAASDFLTNAISLNQDSHSKRNNEDKNCGSSVLTKMRPICESDIYAEDCIFGSTTKINTSSSSIGIFESGLASVRRKSVSFMDLTGIGLKLSVGSGHGHGPTTTESGYSSSNNGSTSPTSSSSCSSGDDGTSSVWLDSNGIASIHAPNSSSVGVGSGFNSIQGKRTVWKSWLKNKLHLNKNGKYSLAGSLSNLGTIGLRLNKSLLVECGPDTTEYSTQKFYTLQKIPNNNNSEGVDYVDCSEISSEPHNLFVRECLKTYTASHLELVEQTLVPFWSKPKIPPKPFLQVHDQLDGLGQSHGQPNGNHIHQVPLTAPDWFWDSTTLHKETPLDEAGIALEGVVKVNYKNVDLGDHYIQVKWDSGDESFYLIVWKEDVGREYIVKVDIQEVVPLWNGDKDNKLSLPEEGLVFSSEQKPGILRALYTICSELGSYEKSAGLASSFNVQRAEDLVGLFQRVTLELTSPSPDPIKSNNNSPLLKLKSSKTLPHPHPISPIWFTLQLESLEFRLKTETGSPIEPYYVVLCLFDVKNGRKISEDFHSTVDIHGNFVTKPKALFRISDYHDQIYLVIRVEKTLQPAESDAYLRGNPDGKTGSRISKNVTSSPLFTNEQRYRMPLGWSTRPLFRKTGSTGSGLDSCTDYIFDTESPFSPFYKYEKYSDDELLKLLSEIKKPEKLSRLTLVPGNMKASVEITVPGSPEKCGSEGMITTIKEFPSLSVESFSHFSHCLYAYPITLNLSPVASKIRARNVLCRVYLRSEDDIEASPLETNPGDGQICTFVLHHKTNPEWYSEIKLKLPVALDPRLHLLFQFYHISCSFEKPKQKQIENLIGYSWIPLLNKFRFIGGDHVLPVSSTLPSGYLQIQPLGLGRGSHVNVEDDVALDTHRPESPQLFQVLSKRLFKKTDKYSGPEISWLEKCTFSVKLHLLSTVWTKCGSLGAFFAHAEKVLQKGTSNSVPNPRFLHCDDENTIKAMKTLETIDLGTLRDFFPTIINQICNVALMSNAIANGALRFLIFAFHSMTENGMESIIEEYTQLRFLAVETRSSSMRMSEVLLKSWIDLFEAGDGPTIANSLEHSKHLFAMILKSIAVEGIEDCKNPDDSKLVKLIQLFTCEVVQRVQPDQSLAKLSNENLSGFICSALSVVQQRQVVFAVINSYLCCFGPGDSYKVQDLRFNLLHSLVKHPLFLELNSASGDEEYTRLDNASWAKRHFLVATVMKQSRSGLGEVTNVRTLALKPIMAGLALHEQSNRNNQCNSNMWVPWLRVVCDNLHRISTAALNSGSSTSHSSRCSSVSTLGAAGTLVQSALLSKNLANDSSRKSSLRVRKNGLTSSPSTNSSMSNISSITGKSEISTTTVTSDRMSLDRLSISNCDYLDAISAIKMSHPAATSTITSPSVITSGPASSSGSGTGTIVNENGDGGSGSGEGGSKEHPTPSPSEILTDDEMKIHQLPSVTNTDNGGAGDKSNVVLRRYDKLNDIETSQLLLSGLYVLKGMSKDGLKSFWSKSNQQERSSLLQMVHLACAHFTNCKKNSTITRKKVVGILVPPTMPPSPRNSLLPSKKWSSLPLKGTATTDSADSLSVGSHDATDSTNKKGTNWKNLNIETNFICIDTLSNLCTACKGENNEMRDIIRTTLDVAKTSEDTRALLSAFENLLRVDELATIVFAKGNEDLSHQLFCELLNGFGSTYVMSTSVGILSKLYLSNPNRTISQSLFALSSLNLTPGFVYNFRKSLALLERSMSLNERSSFVLSITEKLSFIDIQEFDSSKPMKQTYNNSFKHLAPGGRRKERKLSLSHPSNLPNRLATIINSLWFLKSCSNDYRISELYLKLANYYSHYAKGRLRFESFDLLKEEHLGRKRYSEALLCELHVAAGLGRHGPASTPEVRKILLGISQNLKDEFQSIVELPTISLGPNEPEEDTTEELIQRLESCVNLCEKAERYELMLEVYRILVDIQESLADYAALEHSYKQMSRACSLIQNKRERFFATYYRVAIYHPRKSGTSGLTRAPPELYVYKEPNVTSLMEICSKVESSEGAIIISGDAAGEQIPNDENIYATITHVSPIPSESPRRKLWSEEFRKHQNVCRFTYDTPFMKMQDRISIDNKAAVNQQWKRRTTIHTEYTFPAVVSRLRVINSEEEDLSPIIVAIDDMERRVQELRSELHSIDLKRIQLRLQGSVSVQVNQGPLAYARAFLDKEHDFPVQDINKLKAIFRDFVECCGELLILNGQLISPDQTGYQNQLEQDYSKLCQVLSSILGLPETALNRMSRISISSC